MSRKRAPQSLSAKLKHMAAQVQHKGLGSHGGLSHELQQLPRLAAEQMGHGRRGRALHARCSGWMGCVRFNRETRRGNWACDHMGVLAFS